MWNNSENKGSDEFHLKSNEVAQNETVFEIWFVYGVIQ